MNKCSLFDMTFSEIIEDILEYRLITCGTWPWRTEKSGVW